jgi:hypothetical protein
VIGKERATYVSGPITTGLRFVDWFLRTGSSLQEDAAAYHSALMVNVIRPNASAITNIAEILRAKSSVPTIEPASLMMESWDQKTYYEFWMAVIDRYVGQVIVIDDWQFSVGCAVEVKFALERGIQVETLQGKAVTCQTGNDLLLTAAADIEGRGARSVRLMDIANRLRDCVIRSEGS